MRTERVFFVVDTYTGGELTRIGGYRAVILEIYGNAYVTAISQVILDPEDALKYGLHRDQVTACIASGSLNEAKEELVVKEFSSMTYGLRELSLWLKEHNVEYVAMESTGVFWKPVFNILEGDFEVILANAAHVKNIPGLKTDKKDARD